MQERNKDLALLRIEAESYDTDDSRLLQLVKFPELAAIIATRKTLSEEIMATIAASGNHDAIHSMLLHHGPIPANVFAEIWDRHPNSVIRRVLAYHPFTPRQILERLAFDDGQGVAEAFRHGPASGPMKAASELYHALATAEALGTTSASLIKRAITVSGGVSALARRLGVTPQAVQNWRQGIRKPRPAIAAKIREIALSSVSSE
jgi:DNA-binding transcriptional regulator YiaG